MCSDCHVPHEWTDKIARKMQASKEVWGKIFGTIDTREKFLAKRLELAAARMGAASRPTTRWSAATATTTSPMDFTRQSPRAAKIHEAALGGGGQTCIDCSNT